MRLSISSTGEWPKWLWPCCITSDNTCCFINALKLLFLRVLQFFASDERIKAVRKMIMAVTHEQRKAALDLLLPYQRSDFEGIFRAMDGTYHFRAM